MTKYVLACLIALTASPAAAQYRSCLGDTSPACRLERQMEEQERQNRLRHEEMMQEMRRQQQYQPQLRPNRQPELNFPRVFDGPFKAF